MPALLQEKRDGGTTRSGSDSSLVGRSPTTYDCEEDLPPLVFRKPCWQLYATLISTLITPLLYRLYLILVTIGWALFSKGTSGSYINPFLASTVGVSRVPEVDLSWTGLLPSDPTGIGWRGSAVSVAVVSFFIVTCYSLAIVWLLRFKPRRRLGIKIIFTRPAINEVHPNGLQRWKGKVEGVRRVLLTPVLNVCLLVMLHLLLLRSGDVESNPGPFDPMPLTLRDLSDVYEKVYSVRPKWYNFGLALELSVAALDSIRIKYLLDPSDCLRETLKARLKLEHPLMWREIIRALRKPTVGESELADQLEREYDPPKPSDAEYNKHTKERSSESQDEAMRAKQHTPPVKVYQIYLKGVYSVKQLPVDEKYPIDCVKHFVNLECADVRKHLTKQEAEEFGSCTVHGDIEHIQKERITMDQVAAKQGDSYPKLVLVKGAPGVGKTTFSCELCRRWSAGQLLPDYSLVVLLRLRDENVQAVKTLADLFQCEDDQSSTSIADYLKSVQGTGVLFILEGLDELPPTLREDKNSIFMKLIMGRLLPASTVMVTTRPWAAASLPKSCKSRIDQHIDILGFSKKQIDEYVEHMIKDGVPEGLRTYISANPHISGAMYNPLHARIVVEVYRECSEENKSIFPNTTTELYTAYSTIILHRYLTDHPADQKWNGGLSALPPSVELFFNNLCRVAYEGFTKQQLVFSKEDIPDGFATLGFMNSIEPLHQTVTKVTSPSYNFLHFTLQEYLAAVYIWKNHTPEQHMILFETNSINGTYDMILTFLAGLTKFEDEYTRCVLPVPFFLSEPARSLTKMFEYSHKHILWLCESQNVSAFHGDATSVFSLSTHSILSAQYYFALGYCIASSKYPLRIHINMTSSPILLTPGIAPYPLDSGNCKMLVAGAMKSSFPIAKLKRLSLYLPERYNTEDLSLIFDKFLRYIICVGLEHFSLKSSMVQLLPESLLNLLRTSHNLKTVDLCCLSPFVRQESMASMFEIFGSKPCLEMLTFELGSIADFDLLSNLIVNSSSLKTLVLKLPLVSRLSVGRYQPTVTVGFNIDSLKLHHGLDNHVLTDSIFHLTESDRFGYEAQRGQFVGSVRVLTQDTVKKIAGILRHFPHSLELLNLHSYFLNREGFYELANSITACFSLKELHVSIVLSDTLKSVHSHATNGIKAMAEAINGHKSIQTLHVTDCSESLYKLLLRLDSPTSLRSVLIENAIIRKREAEMLAALLRNSQSLEALQLYMFEKMEESDLELVMDALQSNSFLKKLRVVRSDSVFPAGCIYQDGARSIAEMLETNQTLEYFELSCEYMYQPSVLQPIAQAVCKNTTLKTLKLQYLRNVSSLSPAFRDEMAAFGAMLAKNKSLLCLSTHFFSHSRSYSRDLEFDDPDQYSPLMEGLAVNKTLQELCLP